ncbi:hypothetical protein ACHAXS_012754 [Conticribra weissflogii]
MISMHNYGDISTNDNSDLFYKILSSIIITRNLHYSIPSQLFSGEDNMLQLVLTMSTAFHAFFTSGILIYCFEFLTVTFCRIVVKP